MLFVRDIRFLSPCKWDLRSSGVLLNVDLWLFTDVSGQAGCPIFQGKSVQDLLTVEDGTDWTWKMEPTGCPKTSVNNIQSTLRNIPEEKSSMLFMTRNWKSAAKFNLALTVQL